MAASIQVPAVLKPTQSSVHSRKKLQSSFKINLGNLSVSAAKAWRNNGSGCGPLRIEASKRGFGGAVLPSSKELKNEGPLITNPELQIEEIPDGRSRARLVITVPANVCQQAWKSAVNGLQQERKAGSKNVKTANSESVLLSMYGSEEIKRLALDILMRETAEQTFATVADRMISNKYSQHFLKSGEEMIKAFDQSKPFTYEVYVDLYPKVSWISERAYDGMDIKIKMDGADPTEEAQKELDALLRDKGSLRVKQEGGLQIGDVGIMDLETTRVNEDGTAGEVILSCCQKGFTVDTESSTFMPGLVPNMIGMLKDESRTFDLIFPSNWPVHSLRGITGRFNVTCQEVFLRDIPDLDDALAAELVPGASTAEEVRVSLVEKHNALFKDGAEQAVTLAVLNQLLDVCIVEVPDSLVLEDAQQLFMLHLAQLQAKYNPTPEELKSISSEEQFKLFVKVQKEQCEKRVKQSLAMDDIYERELDTHVTEEELQEELEAALKQFEGAEESVSEEKLKEQALVLLREKKTLAWLSERANISFFK